MFDVSVLDGLSEEELKEIKKEAGKKITKKKKETNMNKRPAGDGLAVDFVKSFNNNTINENVTFTNLLNAIRLEFPNKTIIRIESKTNFYGEPGDLKLFFSDGRFSFVEIKRLVNNSTKGTLANIGTNKIIKEYAIFPKGTKSFADFNKDIRWYDFVKDRLFKYNKNFILTTNKNIFDAARTLKLDNNELSLNTKKEIEEEAKNKKIEYLKYITSKDINTKNLYYFTLDMIEGRHTKQQRESGEIVKSFYVNYITGKARAEDSVISLDGLFIEYEENLTCFKIKNKDNKTVLTIALHWKNVFQGIQTPCMNIFLGR